jgi:hypothetical protein
VAGVLVFGALGQLGGWWGVTVHLGAGLGDVAWAAALFPSAISLHLIHAAA